MTSLAERVLATIRRRRLFPAGSRVLAAVSGGPDSVALVHVLTELAERRALALVGLVHLDHGLRAESARDAAFCVQLASGLGRELFVAREDVEALRRARGGSVEAVAREVRYAYFERIRAEVNADVVAVGHTRDDQAETVLLRLVRGAGVRGLTSIRPRSGPVVRPLIDVSREEVLEYLAARQLEYVVDATNASLAPARNRVRHAVLPALVRHFGPSVPAVLARHADAAREDEILLTRLADEAASRALRQRDGSTMELRVAEMARQPAAIARRLVRSALEGIGAVPGLAHVDAVLGLLESGRRGTLDLPSSHVELCPAEGVLRIRGGRVAAAGRSGPWQYSLPVPGEVAVPEAGLLCRAERRPAAAGGEPVTPSPQAWRAVIAGGSLGPRLVVRAWRAGDRLQPLGLNGRKKVQDLFVDRKVPRAERLRVPIVTDGADRIVWVAGHALAEPFRVTPATKSVVVLSFEPLGGPE